MSRLYLDTSAYLAVLLGEEEGEALADLLRDARLLSSVLLVLEARRALVRLARAGHLDPAALQEASERLRDDVERMELRELTLELCADDTFPLVTTPRSLDLVHLRSALWFHRQEALSRFVTLDRAQLGAARELGLPVGT